MRRVCESLVVLCLVASASCGGSSSTSPSASTGASNIAITVTGAASLVIGQTSQLTATVSSTGQNVTTSSAWQSSNTALATISSTGLVTPLSSGTVVFTATFQGASATFTRQVTALTWLFDGSNWAPNGTAPPCVSPLTINSPVDLSNVTSILYPGQTRTSPGFVEYESGGGFAFYGPRQTFNVTVTLPISGYVVDGARYLTIANETQYLIDVVDPCGIMIRFGHMLTLAPKFAALAATLPLGAQGDSRSTGFPQPFPTFVAGETLATQIGMPALNIYAFDFGVYDLRHRNAISANAAWFAAHPGSMAPYGTCWLDLITPPGNTIVRSLPPGDGVVGAQSDYCSSSGSVFARRR